MRRSLPSNYISTDLIKLTIGESSDDVGTLCRSARVNKWSLYRPGYWYREMGTPVKIKFRAPRGGNYTDERGADPDFGTSAEGYKIGDFRGYLHTAPEGRIENYASTLEVTVIEGNIPATRSVTLNMGEVDWFNESGVFRAKNAVMSTQAPPTKICLCTMSPGGVLTVYANQNGNSEVSTENYTMSGSDRIYQIPLYIPPLASGTRTDTLYVVFYFAHNNMPVLWEETMKRNVSLRVIPSTIAIRVNMDSVAADTLYSKIDQSSLQPEDTAAGVTVYAIHCDTSYRISMPMSAGGTIQIPSSQITDFYFEISRSLNRYDIPLRWRYYYRIEVWRNGAMAGSGTGDYRCQGTSGKPTLQFACPVALDYDDDVRVYFTDMDTCMLEYRNN